MNQQRTKVFDDEHRLPRDLGAEIFNEDCTFIAKTQGVDGAVLVIGNDTAIAALCDPELVDGDPTLAGQCGVQLGRRRGSRQVEGLGQLRNRLAWHAGLDSRRTRADGMYLLAGPGVKEVWLT